MDFNTNENTIRGTVKRIYFENRETVYKAVLVSGEEDDDTVVGKMPDVSVGDRYLCRSPEVRNSVQGEFISNHSAIGFTGYGEVSGIGCGSRRR